MKRTRILGLIIVLAMALGILGACNKAEDALGKYEYSSTSYITVTSFDGTDGRATAYRVVVSGVNNGAAYTTPTDSYESFKAKKDSGKKYTITITIDGQTITGTFDTKAMTITLDGRTYTKK